MNEVKNLNIMSNKAKMVREIFINTASILVRLFKSVTQLTIPILGRRR